LDNVEIDLTEIDWNKLSIQEFHALEQKLQEKHKFIKSIQPKGKRNSGMVSVTINKQTYQIKEVTFTRLKSMKSEKSKQKLINEIISENNPIESLD